MGLVKQKSASHPAIQQVDLQQFREEILAFCQRICPFNVPFLLKVRCYVFSTKEELIAVFKNPLLLSTIIRGQVCVAFWKEPCFYGPFLNKCVMMIYLQAARIYLDKRLLEPDDDAAYPDEENEPAGSSGPHLNISVKCLPGLGFLDSLIHHKKCIDDLKEPE